MQQRHKNCGELIMKKLNLLSFGLMLLIASSWHRIATAEEASSSYSSYLPGKTVRIGIVNTKKCLEESKLGKQKQANFDKMKKQMESVLKEKEQTLEEVESKLNDDDYMDSISDEAANELKQKRRSIRNEGMQLQNQYIQTLQQTSLKDSQKLTESIGKASKEVAQESLTSGQPIDVIFTDEACTYYNASLDVSEKVISKMNALFDAESNKD